MPSPPPNGDRIQQARELVRLSRAEVAQQLKITVREVCAIEEGRRRPSLDELSILVFLTGFPLRFFSRASGPKLPMGSLRLHCMDPDDVA